VAAVEVLYGADVRGADPADLLADRDDADAYAAHLVEEVTRRRAAIDDVLAEHSRDWRPERMSAVDRNVLRVGVLELLEADVPAPAVIDEAVEIAKRFSGAEAGRFVNGVLEAVRQKLGGGGSEGGGGGAGGDGGSVGTGGGGVGGSAATDASTGGGGTDGGTAGTGAGSAGGGGGASGERRESL
jgi:N utilization substance protein B